MRESTSGFDFTAPPHEAGFKFLNIVSKTGQLFLEVALFRFLLLFEKGLDKPLSKASSGQALDERDNRSPLLGDPYLRGRLTLDPEAVLANEAYPKGSPRPFSVPSMDPDTGRQPGKTSKDTQDTGLYHGKYSLHPITSPASARFNIKKNEETCLHGEGRFILLKG